MKALGNPFSPAIQYCNVDVFSQRCATQIRFLHSDEMRVQFGHNDAVMLKVTKLLIGQIGSIKRLKSLLRKGRS